MRVIAVILLLALASACSKRYCSGDSTYTEAKEYPLLKAPQGLSAPEPDPNLAIPKPASRVFAKQAPDTCLETPPRLPEETKPQPKAAPKADQKS